MLYRGITLRWFPFFVVAERMLASDDLCLEGATLTLLKATRRAMSDFPVSVETEPAPIAGEWMDERHQTDTMPGARASDTDTTRPLPDADRTVLVRGIALTTEKEVLRLFFQSKRRSQGGKIDNVVYTKSKGEATITFQKREGI